MKVRSLIISMVFIPLLSFGEAQVDGVKVVNVRADKDGKGYVTFDQPLSGTPASCISGGHTRHLAFDLNTEGGKGIMSIALAAQASGKSIKARGTGQCDIYGIVESWAWGYVYN